MEYVIDNKQTIIKKWDDPYAFAEVPETVEGFPVTEIGPYAFSDTEIEEVILPPSLKRIGRYAFYNCRSLERIECFSGIRDLGAGAFTGCHHIHEIEMTFQEGNTSILREFLLELSEEQTVTLNTEHGTAKLLFPAYFEESVENTPARILMIHTHGSGMTYRNSFLGRELSLRLYDEQFVRAASDELPQTSCRLALLRLLYPHELSQSASFKYREFLREHLREAALASASEDSQEAFLCLAKCCETGEEMAALIETAREARMAGTVSALMQERHRRGLVKS